MFQRYALIAAFEGGIEIIGECDIKAAFMICVGKASRKVGDSNADFSAGLCDAVEFHNGPKGIVEMLQNMVGLNQLKMIIREGIGEIV